MDSISFIHALHAYVKYQYQPLKGQSNSLRCAVRFFLSNHLLTFTDFVWD